MIYDRVIQLLHAAINKYLRQKFNLSALNGEDISSMYFVGLSDDPKPCLFILAWLTVTCWQVYVTIVLGSTLGILRAYVRLPIKSLWKPSRTISLMTAGYVYALWFPSVCREFRISFSSLGFCLCSFNLCQAFLSVGSFTCWLCGLAVTIRLHSVSIEKQIVLT